jgi:hypothetical protein
MRRILFLPLLVSILLASVHARADNAALGEVDAPGQPRGDTWAVDRGSSGRYTGGIAIAIIIHTINIEACGPTNRAATSHGGLRLVATAYKRKQKEARRD